MLRGVLSAQLRGKQGGRSTALETTSLCSASTLGCPGLSCPTAPLQWVPDSPAPWEEVAGAHGEHRDGLPASLQPQPTLALGFLRVVSDPNKAVQVLMTSRPCSRAEQKRWGSWTQSRHCL